mgnify:CR=1 FL=1
MSQKMDTDDFLAHYGVKGMRWGVRKNRGNRDEVFRARAAEKKADGMPTRRALRAKNKIARSENRAANRAAEKARIEAADARILAARDQLKQDAANYKTAKAQYKIDKQTQGRVAAKRALNEVRAEYDKNWDIASELTNGEQGRKDTMDLGLAVVKAMRDSETKERQRNIAKAEADMVAARERRSASRTAG